MGREELKRVREIFDAWNRGDLERILEYISPEWEWHTARLFPGTDAVYHGKQRFRRFRSTFREPRESIRVDIDRIEDLGERVLVLMTFHCKGKGSGVDVTTAYANLITFRDGLAVYQVGYGLPS